MTAAIGLSLLAGVASAEVGRTSAHGSLSRGAVPLQIASASLVLALPAVTASGVLAQTRVKAEQGYNSDYMFGMSKGIADSTLVPALKAPIFLLTIPLDLVFLPFAAIGGFFG